MYEDPPLIEGVTSMTQQIVSFHCVLKDRLGHVISSSFNQNVSTGQDPSGQLRGFTRGMQDLKKGERRSIYVGAEEAYGFYDMTKVLEIAREDLSTRDTVQLGDVVMVSRSEEGSLTEHRVIELKGDLVVLDSNHPLAGQDLIFEIEATDVRDEEVGAEDDEAADEVAIVGNETPTIH